MEMLFTMRSAKRSDDIPGICAHCGKQVWESLFTLDDAYNVWTGQCPHCSALNYLSTNHGLRGYCSSQMWLVLPTPEEAAANGLPVGIPLAESRGPATLHGSNLGELLHKLTDPGNGKE